MKIKLADLVALHKPLNEESIVFDVGGYKGEYTDLILEQNPKKVYVFEPDPELFKKLEGKFGNNLKVKLEPFALGGETCVRKFYLSKDGLANSFYKAWAKSENSIDVPVISLIDYMNFNRIDFVDILKLNCEGAEYEILEDIFTKGRIRDFGEMLIQFHKVVHRHETVKIRNLLSDFFERIYDYKFDLWKKK